MPTPSWIRYTDPSGYTLEHPPGWAIEPRMAPIVLVGNCDQTQLALIETIPVTTPGTPADILRYGRFTATEMFQGAKVGPIAESPNSASCPASFVFPGGRQASLHFTCVASPRGRTLFIALAPAEAFPHVEPILRRILDSYRPPETVKPVMPALPPLTFVPFVDPVAGTFSVEVPRGWQVRGGLHHPGLGDRRLLVEAQSPEGILLMQGDPDCPQSFCHYPMQVEDVMIPSTVGCTFLNIPPSGKRHAGYYFKHVAPKRFGPIKITGQRDRPDIAADDLQRVRQMGIAIPKSIKVSVHETRFEVGGRNGCCYASSWHDKSSSLGFMTMWEGCVHTWLAPPPFVPVAEQAMARLRTSYRITPRFYQVVQQDEMLIASNGVAANMNQQLWFQGQQAVHQAQVAQGDAIVNNYWQQQHVNDGITQSYWNAQHAYDRTSQNYSDATLDRQRLYDDALGKPYDASTGFNYYWLDQQSGQVIGTNTSDPPDYQRNYTSLRKL